MEFHIDQTFKRLHRDLDEAEYKALTQLIQQDGCETPIILGDWGAKPVVVDGHHRLKICGELGIDPPWEKRAFSSRDEALEWAIRQQLGRRNLSSHDFRMLLGRLYQQAKKPTGRPKKSTAISDGKQCVQNEHISTHEKLAKEHGVSPTTVRRAAKTVEQYDKLTPAAKRAVDDASATDKQIAILSSLNKSEQNQIARALRVGQVQNLAKALPKAPKGKPTKERSPDEEVHLLKIKAIKYSEALTRSIDDLHAAKPNKKLQAESLKLSQQIWKILKEWS